MLSRSLQTTSVPVDWDATLILAITPREIPSSVMPIQPIPMELYRRDSSGGDLRPVKRVRASRPKVRSGCITCKTRRVKCDETKPHCVRCQKFGRLCDGYPQPPSENGLAIVPIQPREPFVSRYSPSLSIHNTEDESRYFQIFVNHSAQELTGFFDPTFWAQLVTREAHSLPAIRHAAIAIGALNKSLENAPGPSLKVNIIQSVDKRHHEAAVSNYLKAIQALNNYITASNDPQLRTALVACLLFICFETFQGSIAASVQQTYGGLKILRNYHQENRASKACTSRKSSIRSSSSMEDVPERRNKEFQSRTTHDMVPKAVPMQFEESDTKGFRPNTQGDIKAVSNACIYDSSVQQRSYPQVLSTTSSNKENTRTAMPNSARRRSVYATGIICGNTSEEESSFMRRKSSVVPMPDTLGKFSVPPSSTNYAKPSVNIASQAAYSTISTSSVSTTAPYTSPYTDRPSSSTSSRSSSKIPSPSQVPPPPSQPLTKSRKRPLILESRSPTPPAIHNTFAFEDILIQTFVRLDGQGLFFGMTPSIPPLIWDIHSTWHLPIPVLFPDFPSAHRCWDFLMDRALQFFRRISFNRAYAPANLDPPEQIAAELKSYLDKLDSFAAAFQPILDLAISGNGTILDPAALLLSLYHKITIITLAAIPNDSEMVYDTYLSSFKYIVHIAALLTSHHSSSQRPSNPRFTFDVGIIPPLHVVATKCREPRVRREAVRLLFKNPRQEGIWDGILTARIGTWMIRCEEDGLDSPPPEWGRGKASQASSSSGSGGRPTYASPEGEEEKGAVAEGWTVPEENRVRLTATTFHVAERHIKVKCQKTLPDRDGKREQRETIIAW